MMTPDDRQSLSTVRRHLQAALRALPQTVGNRWQMRPILASLVASITDDIGDDDAPVRDLDAELEGDPWHDRPAAGDCRGSYRASAVHKLDDLLGRASVNPDGLSPRDAAALESVFEGARYDLDFSAGTTADGEPGERAGEDCGTWPVPGVEAAEFGGHYRGEC